MVNHINAVMYYGNARIKTRRRTLWESFKLWRRRRWYDDLSGVGT